MGNKPGENVVIAVVGISEDVKSSTNVGCAVVGLPVTGARVVGFSVRFKLNVTSNGAGVGLSMSNTCFTVGC